MTLMLGTSCTEIWPAIARTSHHITKIMFYSLSRCIDDAIDKGRRLHFVWFGLVQEFFTFKAWVFFFVPLMITTSFRFSTHKLSPCFFMHTILLLYNAAAFGYRKLIEIALDTAIHHAVCRFVHWKLKATRTETTQKHKLADTLNLRLRNRNRELRMHGHNNKKT